MDGLVYHVSDLPGYIFVPIPFLIYKQTDDFNPNSTKFGVSRSKNTRNFYDSILECNGHVVHPDKDLIVLR